MNQYSCKLALVLGTFAIVGLPILVAAEERSPSPDKTIGTKSTYIRGRSSTATTVGSWIAQAKTAIVKVTDIQLNPTETGLEIVLQTLDSKVLAINPSQFRTEGKELIAEIPAILALPRGRSFVAENLAADIASVQVTQKDSGTIRVTVVGKGAAVPKTPVSLKTGKLVYALKPMVVDADEEEITVTAERTEGAYRVPNASSATGTETPILETPFSIQVIPKEVIRDQQAVQINDVVKNTSGVIYRGDITGRSGENFILRGFPDAPVLRDGVRQSSNAGIQPITEIANVERIEILKGPASILYGTIEPGGLINLVTKKPLSNPLFETELQLGSRGLFRPRFDISGPLTADKRVLFRLNGLYQSLESFRNYEQNDEKLLFAPALTFKLGDRTTLNLAAEYIKAKRPADFGLPSKDGEVIDVPRDRIINEPTDTVDSRSFITGYTLDHQLNNQWKLKNSFRYSYSDYNFNVVFLPFNFDPETNTALRFPAVQEAQAKNYTIQTNLVGEFATGRIQHKLLAGFDYIRRTGRTLTRLDREPSFLDVFNPVYGAIKPDKFSLPAFADNDVTGNDWGFFLQDQVALSQKLKLLAGLRYDTVSQTTVNIDAFGDKETTKLNESALTPRLGLLYQLTDRMSIYGSYSQSFKPNTDSSATGRPLDPERGKGYEFGLKTELLDRKLLATIAYFDITKQNVAGTDPDFPLFSITTGEQRSRGIELDVAGELTPGWKVIGSYSYTNAKITADVDPTIVGNKLFSTPDHAASLWTTYEIQKGNLQGLGAGLGLNYVGNRQGNLDNTDRLGSYLTADAALFYKRDRLRFGLNFKNIGNVKYVQSSFVNGPSANNFGAPFTVVGSVSVEF
jgi:iron complex outermembrane recepter protein